MFLVASIADKIILSCSCASCCCSCDTVTVQYLSWLVGAHEKGMSPEAFRQTPAATHTRATFRRLPAGVADHRAAPQVVLVVCAASAVSSLQGATQNVVTY